MRYYFLVLTMLLGFSSKAQNLYAKKYIESDGLASSKVYSIHSDSKGYLWFATEEGVSRYNGFQFENFTSSDGFPDNDILSIYEDSQGRLWFATFNGVPCFIQNNQIYSPKNLPLLSGFSSSSHIESYFEDSNGLIWICSQSNIGSINFSDSSYVNYNVQKGINIFENEGEVFAFTGRDYLHNLTREEKVLLPDLPFDEAERNGGECMFEINSKQWLVSKANKLYLTDHSISNASLVLSSDDNLGFIYSMKKNTNDEIFVCTGKGVFQFNEDFNLIQILLSGIRVTDIEFDLEDGMWFATANGVYQFPDLNYNELTNKEGYSSKLISSQNLVAFVSDYNKACLYQIESFDSIIEKGTADYQFPIQDLFIKNDTLFIAGDNGIGYLDRKSGYIEIAGDYSVKSILYFQDYWYIGTDRYFFRTRNIEAISNRLPDIFSRDDIELLLHDRCYSLSLVDERIFFGARSGLYEYSTNGLQIIDTVLLKDARVTEVQKYEDQLLIGSYNSGLMRYHQNEISQVSGSENLKINSVKKNGLGELIISSQQGIYKFNAQSKLKLLSSNSTLKINGIDFLGSGLSLVANSKGVLIKSNQQFDDISFEPKIEVKMYDKKGDYVTSKNRFLFEENSISFFIEPITYSGLIVNYRYQLEGSDEDWQYNNSTKQELINYKKLAPGSYVFKVEWMDGQGDWLEESKIVSFEILTPYWLSWWFFMLIVIAIILLLFLIFRRILQLKVQKTQDRHNIKLALAEAEQKALRAQMNPHFIFNSLNSIQNIIVQENYDQAYTYLGKFSKMVRAILENSRTPIVSIQKEIDLLKWYLDIEQLRFQDKFEFEVLVGNKVNLSYKIPSLVVQPIVENAIIHGLFPKKSQELLKLKVNILMLEQELVKIVVEDNGVGRSNSDKKNKQSYGLEMIGERLKHFDTSDTSEIEIIDLKDHDGQSLGTRVELIIKTKK